MPQLSFHKADIHNLDEIMFMYKAAIDDMISHGIMQWDDIYPDRGTVRQDIIKGEMYIAKYDNTLAAVYTVNNEYDDEYLNGNWKNISEPYFVVHRLCVSPSLQNRGIGSSVMHHIEDWAKNNHARSIRLDCFTRNINAIMLYTHLGYIVTGFAKYRKGTFILMEKSLQQ